MNLLQILKQLETLRWTLRRQMTNKGEPQVVTAEVHGEQPTEEEPKGEEPGEGAMSGDYPLEDDNKEHEEEEEEDDKEEEEEDLHNPDFNAMIEEGVKGGYIQVKVWINSSG